MNNELFIQIVSAILTIIVAIITSVVIPWLKTKIRTDQMELLKKYTEYAVRCAEMLYTPEQWREKKDWVMEYITEKVNESFSLTLTYEDINTLIEGVVNEVKR